MVSSLYRRCWSSIASAISLSHSLPLLKDEIELCLLVYVLALATTHSIGFKVSLISCLGLHLLRGGYRWQLVPVYLSACVFFCVQGYVSAMRVMQIFCTLVSVALCYLIPSIPLINGKGKALGVQDLTFDGPSGKFWVRCFYPTKGTATNPEIAEFPVRSKINMKTIVSIATMVLSFSAIVYLEEGDSLPSLRLFSFFFFLHFCRLAYDSVYGLPSTAYIPGSEVVSVLDGVSDFAKLPSVMFSHMSHIRINCTQDAPVYNEAESTGGKLKVAFVLHGLGGTRCFYSFICMRLAAEGYFVICPEFGDGSACMSQLADGLKRGYENYKFEEGEIEASEGAFKWRHGQLEHRAEEMAIIVKHFASMSSVGPLQHSPAVRWQRRSGATTPSYFQHSLLPNPKGLKVSDNSSGVQLDIRNPYIMGHSFGGATAIHVQRSSDKHATDFRSSIDSIAGVACCDPWMWPLTYLKSEEKSEPTAADEANSKTPYLVMHAEYFQWPANLDSERSLVRAVQSVLHVRIRDAGHNNFSDTGFLSPVIMGMVMSPKKVGMQDPVQLQELINDMLVTFFADCHTSPSPPAPDAPTTIAAVDIHNWKPTALNKSLSLAQKANSFEVLEARW